jgi:RES domain-containing protein
LRFTGRAYRAHDPHWSFAPLSGQGAAITGGRFNQKGRPTLYLALYPMTAILEVTQGFSNRLQPLLLCEYDVDCEDIADLSIEGERAAMGISCDDMSSAWLTHQRANRVAPSQSVSEALQIRGLVGAVVPSFAPGAQRHDRNLVLWRWGSDLPHRVTVFDPSGRLPKDQLSWR